MTDLAAYSSRLGDVFQVTLESGETVSLTLRIARALKRHPDRTPFSLEFIGPSSPEIAQGLYRFRHHAMSEAEIFIVPVQRDDEGLHYQAIFN